MVKDTKTKNVKAKSKSNTKTKSITTKDNIKNNLLSDKLYKKGERLYKNKKYDEALVIYTSLNKKYPKNKKVIKRIIESITNDYTLKIKDKTVLKELNEYIVTYKLLANKKELKYFLNKYNEYDKINGNKSKFLLIFLLGWFGVHKFIEKKYVLGVIYLLTFGIFGIGVTVDLINDYAEYENDFELDIVRYIIAVLIGIIGTFVIKSTNYYMFILIEIIISPIVYDKLLKYVPNFIKVIIVVILIFFAFKENPVITTVPANMMGTWVTDNENTNIKSLKINLESSKIKFKDRDPETGSNDYDTEKKIITVKVSNKGYYKFKINEENKNLCIYTELDKCIVEFHKK